MTVKELKAIVAELPEDTEIKFYSVNRGYSRPFGNNDYRVLRTPSKPDNPIMLYFYHD
jgi:hypothetical protein